MDRLLMVARITEPEKGGDSIWHVIEDSIDVLSQKGITPLYLSRRAEYLDTSLIVSSESIDSFRKVLIEILKGMTISDDIHIFKLKHMRLYDIPENIGKDATRFLISIKITPDDAMKTYDYLSLLRPSSDIAFTYLAFTGDHPCDTINISVFSKSKEHMQRFMQQEMRAIPGILNASVTSISKSKRLLAYSEMVAVLKKELGVVGIPRPILDLTDLMQ